MRILKFLIVFLVLPVSVSSAIITRDLVISKAREYASYRWRVRRINPRYTIYSVSGREITGEAYSYGDKATTSVFNSEIENNLIPRNWLENFNSSTQLIYTGIDCSGLVTRCWGFPEYNVNYTSAADLFDYTIPVRDEVKPGDLWWSSAHVFLQSEVEGKVYEANPRSGQQWSGGNRVQFLKRSVSSYSSRSIFPQFTNPYPEPYSGHVGKEFDVSIEVTGSGKIKNPVVTVNGQKFEAEYNEGHITAHVEFEGLPGKGWGVWMAYHIVVQCDNYVSAVDNYYRDSYDWIVYPDTAPPVVVSTDPSNNAENVPIDKGKVIIKFSKPMDENTTEAAFSIIGTNGNGVPIDSFAWEDSNNGNTGVRKNPLQELFNV